MSRSGLRLIHKDLGFDSLGAVCLKSGFHPDGPGAGGGGAGRRNLRGIGVGRLKKNSCGRSLSQFRTDHYKIPLSPLQAGLFVIIGEMTSSEILHLLLSDDE